MQLRVFPYAPLFGGALVCRVIWYLNSISYLIHAFKFYCNFQYIWFTLLKFIYLLIWYFLSANHNNVRFIVQHTASVLLIWIILNCQVLSSYLAGSRKGKFWKCLQLVLGMQDISSMLEELLLKVDC